MKKRPIANYKPGAQWKVKSLCYSAEIRCMTEAFGLSDIGCVRSNNEDCYRIEDSLGLYLLADGMGGANAGEKASAIATETVAMLIREAPERDAGALQAVEAANTRVREMASADPHLEGMGTTLVAVLDKGEELLIGRSVGDSRVYLRGQGWEGSAANYRGSKLGKRSRLSAGLR